MTDYASLGKYTVVPIADLQNLQSRINRFGDVRKGGESSGKFGGLKVFSLDTGAYAGVIALGSKSSDAWQIVDGSAQITPVNLNPLAAGFTIGADSTYAANLLTTDGGNDVAGRAFQTVALKAGSYRAEVYMAAEGTTIDYAAPRLRIKSGSVTAGVGATDVIAAITGSNLFIHPTAAESAATKQTVTVDFTLATDLSVTFTLDVVDEAGALVAGSAYIAMNKFEAVNV